MQQPFPCRIAKFIALAGICSRRQAEQLIAEGRVKIDGQVITSPAINIVKDNIVEVDGKKINAATEAKLWIYYKPVGLVTTHKDPQNRPTVFESLKLQLPRVISVGRLDINSEGLLLLTNNGELARKFELPENQLERVYKVRVFGNPQRLLNDISNCKANFIDIDGIIYRPKSIKLISLPSKNKSNFWFKVTLTEGKNREIRKIFAHYGLQVSRLIRIQYGTYKLDDLAPGEFREVAV